MLKNHGSRVVQSDGSAVWTQVSGVALHIRPAGANAGSYPLKCILNGDKASPLVIEGPDEERGRAFDSVEIVGATPGDKWTLSVAPDAGSARRSSLLSDPRTGAISVAPAGPVVLFSLDSSLLIDPFQGLTTGGRKWVTIGASGAGLSATRPDAIDLTRFTRLAFVCEQMHDSTVQSVSIRPIFAGAGRRDTWEAFTEIAMGNVGEFGAPVSGNGPGNWNGSTGLVELGAGTDAEEAYSTRSTHRPPFGLFGLELGGALDQTTITSGAWKLRLYAVGY